MFGQNFNNVSEKIFIMKLVVLITIGLNFFYNCYAQDDQQGKWKELIKPSDVHLKKIINTKDEKVLSINAFIEKAISNADETFSLPELTVIVNICSQYCNKSSEVSLSLVKLLR